MDYSILDQSISFGAEADATGTIFSGSDYIASDEVSEDFFGGNFLFHRDDSDGTFMEKAEYLGVNLVRFPGGSITEDLFDVNNPDAQVEGYELETLSDFLASMENFGGTTAIVLPIKKYINDGVPIEQAAAEIFNFVRRVTNGEFGDVKVDIFEIGNEFHMGGSEGSLQILDASAYGAYAAAFALAIKEASTYDVDIAVQAGSHWSDLAVAIENNDAIISAFESAGALEAVDQLVFHLYAKDFDDVADKLKSIIPQEVLDSWGSATGRDLSIFISEWNIKSVRDGDISRDYGLAQASAIIELVAEMLKVGVDAGAIWAIQQGTMTELAGREGDDKIRIAGEMFRMLEESIVGTTMVDLPMDSIGGGQVKLHAFENDTKMVIFISARDLLDDSSSFSVELSIGELLSDFTYVWGEKLSTSNPDFKAANAEAILTNFFPELYDLDGTLGLTVVFEHDYEVIKIVLLKDGIGRSDVHLVGDDTDDVITSGRGDDLIEGSGGNDLLIGRGGNDKIFGGQGDDLVKGGIGNDILRGGAGSDMLKGGLGNDALYGGLGNDILRGGGGDDFLFGGSGDDKLVGADGNDRLEGGEGNDTLRGGSGSDTFVFSGSSGNDKIQDFELGEDLIELMGFGNEGGTQTLIERGIIQTLVGNGLMIELGNLEVYIQGIQSYLVETDFVFT